MSYQRKVYTIGHILGLTAMVGVGTAIIYAKGRENPDLVWFMENWGLYIGIACTIFTFLSGLSILGTPWHDEETNKQLEMEHDMAELEWRLKSPEERAIIIAAQQNRLLQLTQVLQNDSIIRNQEQMKNTKRS
jgi:low affinity Fe/Cu permease